MNKLFILLTALVIAFTSCSNDEAKKKEQADLSTKIAELEIKVMDTVTYIIDYQVAKELGPAYIKYVKTYPQDSLAPDYLYKAAELNQALDKGNLSVKYYEQFLTDYPDNERAGTAMFQMAFVYENLVQNKELAVKYFNEFIEKYPNHPLVPSAEMSIENIDKSPEELIKEFQEKEKAGQVN